MFVQKKGICIGSCLAPVLCHVFLAKFDRMLQEALDDSRVIRISRYVDDFLIILKLTTNDSLLHVAGNIMTVFKDCSKQLNFTREIPPDNTIRFLDLRLTFCIDEHLCWMYEPRSKKGILPFASAHSKLVRRSIANMCFSNAIKKSCCHTMEQSFRKQVKRLLSAGFPESLLHAVAETLSKKLKQPPANPESPGIERCKVQVMPYFHAISHNMKRVAKKHGVKVVFSAPRKLSGLCARIQNKQPKKNSCKTQHRTRFADCAERVVYSIPLSCEKVYIGQTGRCINDRIREHRTCLNNERGSNLAEHVRQCRCSPDLKSVTIVGRGSTKQEREIIEAFFIYKHGEKCVSEPSVVISQKEVSFLSGLRHV